MATAWEELSGSSGDAWTRLGGSSGDAFSRLPGEAGDAWDRLTDSTPVTPPTPGEGLLAMRRLFNKPFLRFL